KIEKQEPTLGHPLAYVQVCRDVGAFIVKSTSPRRIQIAIRVSALFEFQKEPAFEPAIRVWVVICDDVSNTHQDTTAISKDGIKRSTRVVCCGVPVTTDQHGQPQIKALQVVEYPAHLHIPMSLGRVRVQMQRHTTKGS